MTSNRILQLEDLLKREISQIILTKVKDDRFKSFNIIDVKAASDLSSAKVYFSIINGNESDVPEIKFLEKFSSMIRSQVASEVVLKKVPKLIFQKISYPISDMSCLFQTPGPSPLDSDRIPDPCWSWKCTYSLQKGVCFVDFKLTVPGNYNLK